MKANDIKNIPVYILILLITWIFIEAISLSRTISRIPTPNPPVLSQDSTIAIQTSKSKEIENYKNLISAVHSSRISIYDNVVSKTLMPIFNSLIVAVLGYIFADKALKAYSLYMKKKLEETIDNK